CGGAPAMQVDHHFHENLTPDTVDALLDRLRSVPGAHAGAGATPSGPHPPTAETPPLATAEGPPADAGLARAAGQAGEAPPTPPPGRRPPPPPRGGGPPAARGGGGARGRGGGAPANRASRDAGASDRHHG